MTSLVQSQGVSRLKELLFDSESRTLADLARRVDALAAASAAERDALVAEIRALGDADRTARLALLARLDDLAQKVGTPERLETSVAGILDGALRRAEAERHPDMAAAVAPLVVRTVKTEIRNSQDDLVEALYPMTGRMVKAYVASAMKDLMEEINRRLEQNPVMLRVAALATGRSPAELALAASQRASIEELYLIRRGTGELVARWPAAIGAANRDHVLSGVISALTEFASEAFSDDGRALRQIDLGASQVYLRLSPAHLLAVRSTGTAHAAVERIIDDEFIAALEAETRLAAATPAGEITQVDRDRLLTDLSQRLKTRIAEKEAELAPPRVGAAFLKLLAWGVGLPLVLWLAWSLYAGYETGRVRGIATDIVRSNPAMRGYPAHIAVEGRGRTVTISGLAPLSSARDEVILELRRRLPQSVVRDQLAVVPSGLANAEPLVNEVRREIGAVARAGDRAALERADRDLETAVALLDRPGPTPAARDTAAAARRLRADVAALVVRLDEARTITATGKLDSDMQATATAIAAAATDLERRAGGIADPAQAASPRREDAPAVRGAERAAIEAGRLARLSAGLASADAARSQRALLEAEIAALRQRLAALESRPVAGPSPRERLDAWTRRNAVFFANGTDYRDGAAVQRQLDELADLLKASDAVVRVVGYTDEIGAQARNSSLSQTRAEKVAADLAQRGVPVARIIAVGRLNQIDIAPTKGSQSANRRVEFEVGFAGETAP